MRGFQGIAEMVELAVTVVSKTTALKGCAGSNPALSTGRTFGLGIFGFANDRSKVVPQGTALM